MNNGLTIGAGATLDVTAGYNLTLQGGNWSNAGTFTVHTPASTSYVNTTVTFSGTGQTMTNTNTGTETFYNLIYNKSANTFTPGCNINVLNLLTITAGTFTVGSCKTLALTGGLVNNGSLVVNGTLQQNTFGNISGTGTLNYGSSSTLNLNSPVSSTSQNGTTITGTGSPQVTLDAANPNIVPGMLVSGSTITTGTTVCAISGTSLILSAAASSAGTNTPLTFTAANKETLWPTTNGPTNVNIMQGGLTLTSAKTVTGTLTLGGGTLTNSTYLTLGTGATIVSTGGALASIPTFGSSVNLTYSGSATKGNEFPTADIINTLTVNNTAGITLTDNRNIPNLAIGSGSSITLNAGKQLTVGTSMTNAGTLNLLSDVNGTATILTPATISGSGTASVSQYLSQDAAGTRNWYVASPVSATIPANYTFYQYVEPGTNTDLTVINSTAYWQGLATGTAYTAGRGYIALPASNGSATFTFNGTLHTTGNNLSVPLTKLGALKTGFNLIGNPYPAHYTVTKTQTDAANALNTIWYRTATWDSQHSKYVYSFQTCLINADGSTLGTPEATTNIIPPMQAFWVRTNTDNSTFTFNGALSHQAANPMKAPAKKDALQPTARFQVSNGIVNDEAIIYSNPDAVNGFDSFDALKMNNNSASVPEIYTLADSQQITINGLNAIPYDTEIPLGFTTGTAGTFSIKASQISNFDAGTQIFLKDNVASVSTDLSNGGSYEFSSDITNNNTSRFALIFKSPSVATGINPSENSGLWISVNGTNQVVINGNNANGSVAVYNAIGQKIVSKNLSSGNTTLLTPLESGVYLVTVSSGAKTVSKKLIIN